MTPNEIAASLGIDLSAYKPSGPLAPAARVGSLIFTSGQTSKGFIGKLGAEFTIEQGRAAARECAVQILQAANWVNGTLDNLRCVKLLAAVNCVPEFTDQAQVVNGASEVFWEVFGKDTRGFHARSALGFVSLPIGVAVEIEAIFEIVE